MEEPSFEEQVKFIRELYKNEIPENDLRRIRPDIIKTVYDYLNLLTSERYKGIEHKIQENQNNIKKQLKQIVLQLNLEKEKSEEKTPQDNESSSTSSEKEKIFETNKKRIHELFLDMFYNYFISFEQKWANASDDIKKKDHYRYLREKLKDIIFKPDGTITPLEELSDTNQQTVRSVIQNSFLDEDEQYIIPHLYRGTNEMAAYIRFVDEIFTPAASVGGRVKHTYKKRPRRKSATKSRRHRTRRPHLRRHRRTSRK
jgi:hypothetical protein